MAKRKEELKELKQPDQFVTFWTHVGTFLQKQRKPILSGIIATLVAVALVQVGQTYFGAKSATRSRAFARIEAIASAALLPESGEAPKSDDGIPRFKTDEERKQAAIKEVDSFVATYGSSASLKDAALLLKAGYLFDLGKAQDALALYDELAGRATDVRLKFLIDEGRAHAHESLGNLDKAIAVLTDLAAAAEKDGFYRDRALFGKARLLEKKGQPKDAVPLYREVVEKYPQSVLREEINDRLALLEAQK